MKYLVFNNEDELEDVLDFQNDEDLNNFKEENPTKVVVLESEYDDPDLWDTLSDDSEDFDDYEDFDYWDDDDDDID